jgi:hypothetical protein
MTSAQRELQLGAEVDSVAAAQLNLPRASIIGIVEKHFKSFLS